MNDIQFLQYALEQSFRHPNFKNFNQIDFQFNFDAEGNGVFVPSNNNLALYLMPASKIKKMIKAARSDAKQKEVVEAYLTYKHDFAENVVIPDNIAEINQLCSLLSIPLTNRQGAQKQRLTAMLMPLDFASQVETSGKQYRQCLAKLRKYQKNNTMAWSIASVKEFGAYYRRVMRHFSGWNLWSWKNKQLLKKYLIEAVEILLAKDRIPSDYAESKVFKGRKSRDAYLRALQQFVLKIASMSDNEALLILLRNFLIDYKTFVQEFKVFRQMQSTENVADVLAFKTATQKVFNYFAEMCYLDAVRTAFIEIYLEKCPVERHQELPTVAPEREFRKVQKILKANEKIDCRKTKTGKMFYVAQQNFDGATARIKKMPI